jgi:tRNA(Ile2) C34 agmatinyltransferase TiaS
MCENQRFGYIKKGMISKGELKFKMGEFHATIPICPACAGGMEPIGADDDWLEQLYKCKLCGIERQGRWVPLLNESLLNSIKEEN